MHGQRMVAFNKVRLVPIAFEKVRKLVFRYPGQHGGTGNLVAVQMKNRQDRTITQWVQEFVRVPTGGKWARLSLAITYNTTHQQIRIIKCGPVSVQQRIAQFTTFIDGPGSIGRGMAGNASGPGKLLEQPLHACRILRDGGIKLSICTFKICVGDDARSAVSGASNVNGIKIIFPDHAIHVRVDEVQPRRGAEMPEQAWLGMRKLK